MADFRQKLQEQFTLFAKWSDPTSEGTLINLAQSDKWMKQAKLIDNKQLTTNDTAIIWAKMGKPKTLNFPDFIRYIERLAQERRIDVDTVREQMANCGPPGAKTATKPDNDDVVRRLTDTAKYTGSHKERFDESGKGKGTEGRENINPDDGYVQGYKNKGTYDKKVSQGKKASQDARPNRDARGSQDRTLSLNKQPTQDKRQSRDEKQNKS